MVLPTSSTPLRMLEFSTDMAPWGALVLSTGSDLTTGGSVRILQSVPEELPWSVLSLVSMATGVVGFEREFVVVEVVTPTGER